ncbi:MAG: hypothetical protein NTW49_14375 [Bacteroidia bacterium]|nr:hypothetical protein [Bacteroidia bacterium]
MKKSATCFRFLLPAIVLLVSGAVIFVTGITSCKDKKDIADPGNKAISVKSHSDCKLKDEQYNDSIPQNQSCLYYRLSHDTLYLTHINAGFNCCFSSVNMGMISGNDTLRITESEVVNSPCDCNCLFDVLFIVTGITAVNYYIMLNEPYVTLASEKLSGSVDLHLSAFGHFCVTRSSYPWGLMN